MQFCLQIFRPNFGAFSIDSNRKLTKNTCFYMKNKMKNEKEKAVKNEDEKT